jgi:hypothetical protein
VEAGRRCHAEVRRLYASAYGDVVYGPGGQVTKDRGRYSRTWHRHHGAARNRNGGARLDGEAKPRV